ncbi:DUF4259 domain-containing protein [Streptomyces sp. NPDC001205]
MATWDVGRFDNDIAEDFCETLDKTAANECALRRTLIHAIETQGYLDADVTPKAVVATQCSAGEPVVARPRRPIPATT